MVANMLLRILASIIQLGTWAYNYPFLFFYFVVFLPDFGMGIAIVTLRMSLGVFLLFIVFAIV